MRRACLAILLVACAPDSGSATGPLPTTTASGGSAGSATTAGDASETMGDDSAGDGDASASAGDGDGTASAGDGDGTASAGDGDGTASAGDGDGTTTAGDGDGDGECDPGDPTSCPAGEKCTGYVMQPGGCCVDANACVPVMGSQGFGDPCTRTEMNDDCAPGLFCMPNDSSGSTGPGVCMQFCDVTNPNSCASFGLPSATCVDFNDGTLPLCQDDCDPLIQNCSFAGQGCYPLGQQGFVCTNPGFGLDGAACVTHTDCGGAHVCVDGFELVGCGSTSCCTLICDTSDLLGSCPDPSETCIPYFEFGTAPPGGEDFGYCGLLP